MGTDLYRRKRRFDETPEPRGEAPRKDTAVGASSGRFVVQRHRARRLHYDFRLEIGGVLVSWAVPRGPSLDPAARRLAVQVEDHPIEYFDFEGKIPGGQYGAGDVIVWDWGTWTADSANPSAGAALANGEFKFRLDGVKLRGGFVLIRTDRLGKDRYPNKWLLIHRKDEEAVAGWQADAHLESVKTGRTNEAVAAGRRPLRTARPPRRANAASKPGPRR